MRSWYAGLNICVAAMQLPGWQTGFKSPRAEMPTFKWLFLKNLRSETLEQIQNLVPHRLMSRLKSKTTQATLFVLGYTPIDVWI
jgi:hypothetical protein